MKSLLALLLLVPSGHALDWSSDVLAQTSLIAPPPSPKLCPEPDSKATDESLIEEAMGFLQTRFGAELDRLEIEYKPETMGTIVGRKNGIRFFTLVKGEDGKDVMADTKAMIVRRPYERRSKGCPVVRGCMAGIRLGVTAVVRDGKMFDWIPNGEITRLKRLGPVEIPTHCPSF